MNGKLILYLIIFTTVSAGNCFADCPDKIRLIDTTVVVRQNTFRLRQIPRVEFDSLRSVHFIPPSEPVTNIEKIKEILGSEYDIICNVYSNDSDTLYYMKEFCRRNKFRVLISPENDGVQGYYPRERIMLYYGGHSSDEAFFTDTGEDAYNPEYSAISANKQFRITGLHSGQDDVFTKIERRVAKASYEWLCSLSEIAQQIPYEAYTGGMEYIFDPFWIGNTLYFRTGYSGVEDSWDRDFKFIAITMPLEK